VKVLFSDYVNLHTVAHRYMLNTYSRKHSLPATNKCCLWSYNTEQQQAIEYIDAYYWFFTQVICDDGVKLLKRKDKIIDEINSRGFVYFDDFAKALRAYPDKLYQLLCRYQGQLFDGTKYAMVEIFNALINRIQQQKNLNFHERQLQQTAPLVLTEYTIPNQ
tara:strand:- start:104068 stop:104553 length:486 start_codon:yes stop_codon:yes gene_type:complete